jgi:hypothetical protein
VLLVADDLHEALGLAAGARAAVGREGELADLVLELLLLALRLGEADAGDFRVAVGGVRDVAVVHRVRGARRRACRPGRALRASPCAPASAGRPRRRWRRRPSRWSRTVVDLDEAALGGLHAGFLEADVLDVRRAAGGHEHDVHLSSFFSPPASTGMVTPFLPFFTVPSLAPVMTSMPRFLKALLSSAEQSSSSTGRMRGITSSSVTLEPKALKTSANSQPTAPAPTTAIVLGADGRASAPRPTRG